MLSTSLDPTRLPLGFQVTLLGDGAWYAMHPNWALNVSLPALRATLAWEQAKTRWWGRFVVQPRLTAYYGDPGARYRYSGRMFCPLPWAEALLPLLEQLRGETQHGWNACLANLYRDGRDSIGLHADDEPELGPLPQVASLSLGASRKFVIRHARDKGRKHELLLTSNTLLLMGGTMQHHWKHEVPKTTRPVGERLNLTFRVVRQQPVSA